MKIRFNLLPVKQKKHLQTQKIFRIVMEQEIQVMILVMFMMLAFGGMYFVLKTETLIMQDIKEKIIQRDDYKEIANIHDKFSDIHLKMNNVNKLVKGDVIWSRLLIFFSENINKEIMVNSIKTSDDRITISAVAQTREDVITMKETFDEVVYNDVKCFENIVVPESELTVPIDVAFTMTLKVNLECLR
jgi:Tfp pilus assembly protein PilN